jgi:hypothetical protein
MDGWIKSQLHSAEIQQRKIDCVMTFLSYKFQIKTRMLRINPFTYVQSFQTAGPYTNILDSLCLFIIISFSLFLIF